MEEELLVEMLEKTVDADVSLQGWSVVIVRLSTSCLLDYNLWVYQAYIGMSPTHVSCL